MDNIINKIYNRIISEAKNIKPKDISPKLRKFIEDKYGPMDDKDFFSDDLAGGGHAGGAALNDEIVIDIFTQKGENVSKIKSSALSEEFLEKEKDSFIN